MSNNAHNRPKNDPVMRWLRRQAWTAEGRHDGFTFALKCEANREHLREELEYWLNYMADHNEGRMGPTAGPRIYREGYVSALEETIDFIDRSAELGA
jgi:hypothetical protein